jgi:hypothetical protein
MKAPNLKYQERDAIKANFEALLGVDRARIRRFASLAVEAKSQFADINAKTIIRNKRHTKRQIQSSSETEGRCEARFSAKLLPLDRFFALRGNRRTPGISRKGIANRQCGDDLYDFAPFLDCSFNSHRKIT